MRILIFKKLSLQNAVENMELIEKFFLYNPKKQVCITDLFKVRRGRIVEDVLKHTDYKSTIND